MYIIDENQSPLILLHSVSKLYISHQRNSQPDRKDNRELLNCFHGSNVSSIYPGLALIMVGLQRIYVS
jgi:hypothetical protein